MKIQFFTEIKEAVSVFHKSGLMHRLVGENIGKICHKIIKRKLHVIIICLANYFEENIHLKPFLQRLQDANKQLFLITNSAFWYVNRGMTYLLGRKWQDFFDIVICQARKPSFFGAQKRFSE